MHLKTIKIHVPAAIFKFLAIPQVALLELLNAVSNVFIKWLWEPIQNTFASICLLLHGGLYLTL